MHIIKDNKKYIPQDCYKLQPPFSFEAPGICMYIPSGSNPIYFERITNKISNGSIDKLKHNIFYGYKFKGKKYLNNKEVI